MDNHATLLSPPGRFAEVDGAKIHWQEWGASTSLPAILLECGLCMMSACWGWLAPALARHTRVLAWDRPGLGWSQELPGPRNAARIAGELLQFIPTVAANEPLVLLGHSMGALIARAALAQSPGRFPALIFLDASHPGQRTQPMTRRRMRNFFLLLEGANLLASRGLPVPTLPLASELEHLPGRSAFVPCISSKARPTSGPPHEKLVPGRKPVPPQPQHRSGTCRSLSSALKNMRCQDGMIFKMDSLLKAHGAGTSLSQMPLTSASWRGGSTPNEQPNPSWNGSRIYRPARASRAGVPSAWACSVL